MHKSPVTVHCNNWIIISKSYEIIFKYKVVGTYIEVTFILKGTDITIPTLPKKLCRLIFFIVYSWSFNIYYNLNLT